MKGYLRRRQQNEVLAVSVDTFFLLCVNLLLHGIWSPPTILPSQRRIVTLNEEVDRGIDTWKKKQEEDKIKDEHKKSLLLKAKGKMLMKKKSQS